MIKINLCWGVNNMKNIERQEGETFLQFKERDLGKKVQDCWSWTQKKVGKELRQYVKDQFEDQFYQALKDGNVESFNEFKSGLVEYMNDYWTMGINTSKPEESVLVSSQPVNLSGANLPGAKFYNLTFPKGSNFNGANLEGACFDHSDIRNNDFRGANLKDVNAKYSDARGALFDDNTILDGANFWASGANYHNVKGYKDSVEAKHWEFTGRMFVDLFPGKEGLGLAVNVGKGLGNSEVVKAAVDQYQKRK